MKPPGSKLHELLRLIHSWKSTRMTVAGHVVNYWQLASRLAQVKSCHARKVQHERRTRLLLRQTEARVTKRPLSAAACCAWITRQIHGRDSWIQFGALSAQHDFFRVHKPVILAHHRAADPRRRLPVLPGLPLATRARRRRRSSRHHPTGHRQPLRDQDLGDQSQVRRWASSPRRRPTI